MLQKYDVIFTIRPASKVVGTIDYTFNPTNLNTYARIIMKDILTSDSSGNFYPVGIKTVVITYAESKDEAIEKAHVWAGGLISLSSFTSNVGMPNIRAELAYETQDGKSERDFIQFFYEPPVPMPSSREIPFAVLGNIIEKLYVENNRYSDRVQRTIANYSKSLVEEHPIDQFNALWLGFEALNQPLKDAYSIPDQVEKCKMCGNERTVPSTNGIKAFLDANFPEEPDLYSKARDVRVSIMHSTKNLYPIMPEVVKLIPKLRKGLRRAVFQLLNLNVSDESGGEPIQNIFPVRTALEAKLVGASNVESLKVNGEEPQFILTNTEIQPHVEMDSKEVTFKIKTTRTAVINPPASFQVYAHRIYGDPKKITGAKTDSIGPTK